MYRLVGLAHDHGVHKWSEREGVAERQRPARQDERVLLGAVFRKRWDAGQLQGLNQSGELGLVRHGQGDNRIIGDRP